MKDNSPQYIEPKAYSIIVLFLPLRAVVSLGNKSLAR